MKSITLTILMGLALQAHGRGGEDGGGIIIIGGGRHQIELGEAVTGGTACNYEGSVDIELEDDGKLKVDFDDFSATMRGSRIERATCMFSAPISWPRGQRVVIKDLGIRGHSAVSYSTRASVAAEMFMTGGFGETLSESLSSGVSSFNEKLNGEVYSSDCSGSGLLRLNSNIRLIGSGYGGAGKVEVRKISAELSLESCH